MASDRFVRRTGIFGVLFVAFLVAGAVLAASTGSSGDTVEEVTSFYEDDTNDVLYGIAALLIELAVVCLVPFAAGVQALLRRAEGDVGGWATVAFGGGLLMAGLLAVLGTIVVAVPSAEAFLDDYAVNKDVAQSFEVAAWWGSTYASAAASVFIGATAIGALATRALPKWLAVAGLVVAVIGLFGLFLWGAQMILQVLWLLVIAVRMARGAQAVERAPRGAALGSV